jgi:hypothetical protein
VDFNGTLNLISAAQRAGATRFVLVSSIGADELVNPLNLFWGVLVWKKQARRTAGGAARGRRPPRGNVGGWRWRARAPGPRQGRPLQAIRGRR